MLGTSGSGKERAKERERESVRARAIDTARDGYDHAAWARAFPALSLSLSQIGKTQLMPGWGEARHK